MTLESFPPEVRLRQSGDFRAVFADGQRYVRSGFVVIVAPSRYTKARLGLAIAKRRVPRAVDRNRIKRIVRDSFRRTQTSLNAVDIVVLARSRTVAMSNGKLRGQLRSIWLAAGPDK